MRKGPHRWQRTSLLRDSNLRLLALSSLNFATALYSNPTRPRTFTRLFYHPIESATYYRSYGYLRNIQKVDPRRSNDYALHFYRL